MKIVIVEDEYIIAQSLSTTLKRFDHQVLAICSTYDEAIAILSNSVPDIIILDINLKGEKSGIDLAEYINKNHKIPHIFLTSITDKHVLNTLKYLNPSSILIKPFNKHELNAILSLVKHQIEQQEKFISPSDPIKDSLFIKYKNEHVRIQYSDILYLKSNDVYIILKTKHNKTFQFRGTLETYSKKLNNYFVRIHRSFIINTEHIDKVYKEHLLINEDIIPIGNTYRTTILKILKIN